MNRQKKSITVLASVMAMILATPAGVFAEGGRGGGDWNKGGHYNSRYNTYYKGGSYYYPYYYGCNNCGGNSHHHNNHNSNDELWIGLLGGGILGYALGNVLQHNANNQAYYPEPAPAPPRTVTRYETSYANNTCLQEREYRSKIMVGGKQVEGYGTACLQPDGSWRYGPAQPETY
jgi:hypothetical protein